VICASEGSLRDSTIFANSAPGAGGVQLWGGRVENCTISDNAATNGGAGGIQCATGCIVSNCIITGNRALNPAGVGGGVLCFSQGVLPGAKVQGCTISANSARSSGGANLDNGSLLADCSIIGNSATNDGGGVGCSQGAVIMTCTITSNICTGVGAGGGVHLWYGGTLQDCTINNNTSTNGGGVLCNHGGTVSGGTISGNYASNLGGGINYDSTASSLPGVSCSGNSCGYAPQAGWHLVQDVANTYDVSQPYIQPDP